MNTDASTNYYINWPQLEYQENKEISRECMAVYFSVSTYVMHILCLFMCIVKQIVLTFIAMKIITLNHVLYWNRIQMKRVLRTRRSAISSSVREIFYRVARLKRLYYVTIYFFDGANVFKLGRNVFQSKYMCVLHWKVRL